MYWINKKEICGYFGSETDNLHHNGDYDHEKFLLLQQKISEKTGTPLNALFFLKQTHSADIFVLTDENTSRPLTLFQHTGDAIITAEKNIGIGVVTADCLPVILHDPKNHAVGIIHAGWRGLSKKIITATIKKMHDTFTTEPKELKIYLGPSAGVCCYEVKEDLLLHFPKTVFKCTSSSYC
jgi:hypothetical protein